MRVFLLMNELVLFLSKEIYSVLVTNKTLIAIAKEG